jgi:hypothetical protein
VYVRRLRIRGRLQPIRMAADDGLQQSTIVVGSQVLCEIVDVQQQRVAIASQLV